MSQVPGTSSRYGEFGANNIIIVPTVSFTDKKPMTPPPKSDVPSGQTTKTPKIEPKIVTESSIQTGKQIKPTPMDLDSKGQLKNVQTSLSRKFPIEDVNKNIANVEDLNKTKKASWASNYLQSIGHNNIKPIKINLSKSKPQKIETVSTKSNESNVAQVTPLKERSTYCEDFHMTEHLVAAYPKEKIIGEQIHSGNTKTLHPNNLECCGVHFTRTPVVPSANTSIISTSVNSNIVLDTIYTQNNNNTIAPAYATLLAKGNGEATYCYNNGKYEIDILDAIKSKISREAAIEYSRCTMNLPTHKDMCEEFIKEISNKPSTSERKRDHNKSTSQSKKDMSVKKSSTSKLDAKVKKPVKIDEKNIKETLKIIKKNIPDKEVKKSKSVEVNKIVKKKKKLEQEKTQHKMKLKKSIIDLKDFDILTKQIVQKDLEKKPKIDNHISERQKLKRLRSFSEELQNSSSENCAHNSVRSVVMKTEKSQGNSPKRQCLEFVEGFDLRSKLSRANQRIHKKQMENNLNTKTKQRDNMKNKVETQNNDSPKSPKKSNVLKYKTKTRKLKLIINVVCQESDDETSSSDSNISETSPTQNTDLSFLDDFNVDDIVDCLKHSPKHKIKSPLPNVSKLEERAEMSSEHQLNIASILNMLQANAENNRFKNSVKTECNTEETVKPNSSNFTKNQVNPNPDVKMKVDKTSVIRKEENVINYYDENKNATHALIKILSETKSQPDQQKLASPADDLLISKCSSEVIDSKIGDININHEEQLSEDTDMLVLDESVIINERDISLVDLTTETFLPKSSEVCDESIKAISNFIQSEMQNNNVGSKITEKDQTEYEPNLTPDNNLELIPNKVINQIPSNENINNNAPSRHAEVEKNTLDKNDEIIDLTNETVDHEIHEAVGRNDINTQKEVENEVIPKEEIHLIPFLPLPDLKTQITSNKSETDKIMSTNKKPTEFVKNVKQTNNKPTECVKNLKPADDTLEDTNIKINAPAADKSIITSNNNDTMTALNEAITKNLENAKENIRKILETNKVSSMPAKQTINTTKVSETKAAAKILKNIVDIVWDTKNEVGSTSKTNQTENKTDETKTEPENVPKSNRATVENKTMPDMIVAEQEKALVILLEARMLDYLHKEIKVIKNIFVGKYSNIFSCKDSTTGQIYAAKILKNIHNRHALGIAKEQMIRQLQQDIPRENLNTVYLIDGFGIGRLWCFLTEYYPKNLDQVLMEQNKPFHIDLVQELTRQLMSAVMVLRNNGIVHSDIKPHHILMNSTYDRLKLCGFDEAYYGNNVYPLPNIGTAPYRAPEIILGFSAGYSIDVWSSALVIYQMATGHKLIKGVFNNDILYKQLCIFGSLPRDMVQASPYMNQHFRGNIFMRRVGFKGQDAVLFHKFYKTKRLQYSLFEAYNMHWMAKNAYQRDSDKFKLAGLYRLLEQMLMMDPRLRIAIEFVCADPFIYEMFS